MAGVHAMVMGGGGGALYLKPNGVTVAAASEDAKGKWHKLGGKNYYVAVDYADLFSVVSVYKGRSGEGEVLRNLTRDGQTFSIPLNQVVTTYIDKLDSGIAKATNGLFYNSLSFNQLINSWDVSNVNSMYFSFRNCRLYNQPLNCWDTSNCYQMAGLLYDCRAFNQDISSWCVSQIPSTPTNFDGNTPVTWTTGMKPNWGAAC